MRVVEYVNLRSDWVRPGGSSIRDQACPWIYDQEMYERYNEIERLFRRLKGFHRHLPRFEKLYVIFLGFIMFVLIFNALR